MPVSSSCRRARECQPGVESAHAVGGSRRPSPRPESVASRSRRAGRARQRRIRDRGGVVDDAGDRAHLPNRRGASRCPAVFPVRANRSAAGRRRAAVRVAHRPRTRRCARAQAGEIWVLYLHGNASTVASRMNVRHYDAASGARTERARARVSRLQRSGGPPVGSRGRRGCARGVRLPPESRG